ncbi:MAG TPA: hypothetical protein VNA25_22615 [Phycisphaerae bacterium]|nr:hypothetical protein [Phycisphaerae bacterium]
MTDDGQMDIFTDPGRRRFSMEQLREMGRKRLRRCECCGSPLKVYRRKLNSVMAATLCVLTRRGDWMSMKQFPRALEILAEARGPLVLLGKRVAAAFGVDPEYFRWSEVRGVRVAVMPLPSGVNLWWNDPEHRRDAANFLRGLVEETPGGR